MVAVGYVPTSPVIVVAPVVKVIPESARTAKLEAEPRFTATWAFACGGKLANAMTAIRIKGVFFIVNLPFG